MNGGSIVPPGLLVARVELHLELPCTVHRLPCVVAFGMGDVVILPGGTLDEVVVVLPLDVPPLVQSSRVLVSEEVRPAASVVGHHAHIPAFVVDD